MSRSIALVRRSLLGELWESAARVLLVRHEWTLAAVPQEVEDDTVGFAFAHALPTRAVLLDVSHVRFVWCGLRVWFAQLLRRRLTPSLRHAGCSHVSCVLRRAPHSPGGCCTRCTTAAWSTWRVHATHLRVGARRGRGRVNVRVATGAKVCRHHRGGEGCGPEGASLGTRRLACASRFERASPGPPQLLRLVLEELPAWVRTGRYERTDWLCGALQSLWPHLERGICRELQWRGEPVLRALAPGFVRRVRIEELSLGSVAPRITGVLCADEDAGSVELELDVRWSCDGRALLAFDLRAGRRLTFGVYDLTLSGLMRVRLAPLCSRLPGFAAVSLCFAAPPTMHYRLSGVGAVATSIPGFASYLQACVLEAVSAAAVWPRQLVFPLPASVVGRDPTVTASALAAAPAGVLRVTLHSAAELSPAELLGLQEVTLPAGGNANVSTSPYVLLDLPEPPGGGRAGVQQEVTEHKVNNLSPTFEETFRFVVDDPATQRLRVSVRAWNASGLGSGAHSVMGETAVPVAGLRPHVLEDTWWSLTMVVPKSITVQGVMATYRVPSFGGELEEVNAGRLRISLLYTPFRDAPGGGGPHAGDDLDDEDDDEDDDDEDSAEESDESSESDPSSSGEDESEEAEERREARREARRAARRIDRRNARQLRRHNKGTVAKRGVLFVRVERGSELRRVTGAARPADAYVTVMLAGELRREVRKTRVVSASSSPVWNADFALFVDDAPRCELVCAAFDFSGVDAHIPLGEVRLPVLDIVAEQGGNRGVRQSYPLLGAPSGTLQLWLEWRAY